MPPANRTRVAFRVFAANRLTLPLLLNVWEQHALDRFFDIALVEAEPGRLTPSQSRTLRESDACLYSFMTPHLPGFAGEIKALRAGKGPGPLLVAGGPHVCGEQELALACGFDLVLPGPGEESFARLGRELAAGGPQTARGPRVRSVPGPTGTGAPGWERFIPLCRAMETVPPLEITRGCHWKCRYCQTGGTPPRHRSGDAILRYLEAARRRGLSRVGFISPSALEFGAARPGEPQLERIAWLLESAGRAGFRHVEYGIFPSEIRPDTVSAEALRLLRRHVSNRRLTFGAQSAGDARLKAIGRGHSTADIESAVALANEAGFAANLDFIIALPGETEDDRRDLLAFLSRLRRRRRVFIQLHHFFPLSGSALARSRPSFLAAAERRAFIALKAAGVASDGWLAGERAAGEFFSWLEREHPEFFARFA